ncbi:MAG: SDR family oxidoreductase [Hyphomicrobiaceae bacterium]|nr:SDR family oxidoreductase [Hyphomicrobiaceae bacterium]
MPPIPKSDQPTPSATPPHAAPGVALITGAARRIGRAIALDLARHGWDVGIHFNTSAGDAEHLGTEIAALGRRAALLPADLADDRIADGLIARCTAALGPTNCLVNNASAFLHDTIDDLSADIWRRQFRVNLEQPVFLARALYRALPPDLTGNVVNIIDQRVWRVTPEDFSYTISKSGLWTATRTLAQAMAPRVRVNAIGPGPALRSIYQTDADFAAEAAGTLLGRGPTPDEIAEAVRFILAAPAMTGQMIALDGGQHLLW